MIWLFACLCSKFPAWIKANEYSKPFKSMQQVEVKKNDFTVLKKCKKCGQHWQVDSDYKNSGFAIKINDPAHWLLVNDFESRKKAMIENHGGIGDAKCKWSGCNYNAMLDMEFCVECAYLRMDLCF